MTAFRHARLTYLGTSELRVPSAFKERMPRKPSVFREHGPREPVPTVFWSDEMLCVNLSNSARRAGRVRNARLAPAGITDSAERGVIWAVEMTLFRRPYKDSSWVSLYRRHVGAPIKRSFQ